MNTLINIRGGNASGKTTIVRKLIEEYGPTVDTLRPARSKIERVLYSHIPSLNLYVLGSYRVVFGGLDSYDSKEQTFEVMGDLLEKGNVICEGVRASGSINPWDEYLRPKLDTVDTHIVLLNTTKDQMLEASIARTGRTEPFTAEQIKVRETSERSMRKQSTTWPSFDPRYKTFYGSRDDCFSYVHKLAEAMYAKQN